MCLNVVRVTLCHKRNGLFCVPSKWSFLPTSVRHVRCFCNQSHSKCALQASACHSLRCSCQYATQIATPFSTRWTCEVRESEHLFYACLMLHCTKQSQIIKPNQHCDSWKMNEKCGQSNLVRIRFRHAIRCQALALTIFGVVRIERSFDQNVAKTTAIMQLLSQQSTQPPARATQSSNWIRLYSPEIHFQIRKKRLMHPKPAQLIHHNDRRASFGLGWKWQATRIWKQHPDESDGICIGFAWAII